MKYIFPEGYNRDLELVIDPELIFATFSGAAGDNWGMTATYDDDGHLYSGGVAFGDYPTTTGAFDTEDPDFFSTDTGDIGISKYSPDGTHLIYSTYLGGSDLDVPHSLIVNSKGELVIMGTTTSSDYPTANAFNNNFGGGSVAFVSGLLSYNQGSDIVVTILDEQGANLVGSTFIGGSSNDGLHFLTAGARLNYGDEIRGEVVLDESDNIYVASTTSSSDFPKTNNAFDPFFTNGGEDGVVFKLDPTASNLIWSNFLGGSGFDAAFSLKVGTDNKVYVCGVTDSPDMQITSGTLHETIDGATSSAFVVQISAEGDSLLAATYLHHSDFAYFLELDAAGDVYVMGQCISENYPVTAGVYSNENSTVFLHKISPDLSESRFSTVLGNGEFSTVNLVPSALMVDDCGQIFISGWGGQTNSTNISGMPITADAIQSETDSSDFYFMVLAPDATQLTYGTYFGGSTSREHVDGGTSRFDKNGTIYQAVCAGCGGLDDFPTTPGAYSNVNGSNNCNTGSVKISVDFTYQPDIIDNDGTLSISGASSYDAQWVDCNDFTEIPGANSIDFQPPATGSYAVIVFNGSCRDTSECFNFSPTSIVEQSIIDAFTIVPNPTKHSFKIENDTPYKIKRLQVYNQLGSLVRNVETPNAIINIEQYASGIYFLKFELENGGVFLKRLVVGR